jgi:hypothetical protein
MCAAHFAQAEWMTAPHPTPQGRREELEAWWAFVARVLAFFLGAAILSHQAFFASTDRLYIIVAAIGLMGPAVAQAVAQVLQSLRGETPSP